MLWPSEFLIFYINQISRTVDFQLTVMFFSFK
jgi:hypothetical protein